MEDNPAIVTQRLMRDLSLENAEQAAAEVAGFSLVPAQAAEGVAAQVGWEGLASWLASAVMPACVGMRGAPLVLVSLIFH